MSFVLQHPSTQALAWALIHFVWQGAAIGLVALALFRFARLSVSARYTTGVLAIAAMLVAPAITFAMLTRTASPAARLDAAASAVTNIAASEPASATANPNRASGDAARPATALSAPVVFLGLWCSGVVVLSLRLLGGWVVARRLARRAIRPAEPDIQALARRVAGRLGLDRVVAVFESSAVAVPVMIGWMKPVVLLPVAALAGLSPAQLEALLAHELAHVRRHDYLVNLLQSAAETLLFYHPAVWWISRRVRADREHCCDDIALGVCDRIVYATALTDLAAMTTPPRLALAATDGPLLGRVRRILGQSADRGDSGSGWLSMGLIVLIAAAIVPATRTSARGPAAETRRVETAQAAEPQSGAARPVEAPKELRPEGEAPREVPVGMAARERALLQQRYQIDKERAELDFKKAEAESKARRVSLATEMDLLRSQYERAKQQVAVGMLSNSTLAEIQAQIATTEQKTRVEMAELQYQSASFDLKRREMALRLEAEMYQTQVESARAGDRSAGEIKAAEASRIGDQGRLMADTVLVTAPDELVRAGDVLTIEISNEPDLPRAYLVQSDGTIRLPLVGAIRVLGLNVRQAHEAIGKQLMDRRLGEGAVLDMTLRRRKAPGVAR
jgi:beta-lactamase regulating signal transducer with metallopeptidase domain